MYMHEAHCTSDLFVMVSFAFHHIRIGTLASLATMRELQMIMMCMHVHIQLGSSYVPAHTNYDNMPISVIIIMHIVVCNV